jgi:hypothetical protein
MKKYVYAFFLGIPRNGREVGVQRSEGALKVNKSQKHAKKMSEIFDKILP